MTTNLFTKWPLWHYLSLHFQNLRLYDDNIRTYNISASGIPAATEPILGDMISNLTVYDFMNDRIIRAGDVPNLVIVNFTDLANPSVMIGIPANVPLIAKGRAQVQAGVVRAGEFVPIIGTKDNMALIYKAITSQYQSL